MNVRRFRALHERGVPLAEIARECRCDWRTVKKYLAQDGLVGPPRAPSRAGTQPRLIDPFVSVVEAWLRADITVKGAVIHERLVAEHGFTGSYQRVKEYLAVERPGWPPSWRSRMRIRWSGCTAVSRWSRARRPRSTGARKATCSPTSALGTSTPST